jgi:hypothetical protein
MIDFSGEIVSASHNWNVDKSKSLDIPTDNFFIKDNAPFDKSSIIRNSMHLHMQPKEYLLADRQAQADDRTEGDRAR